MVGRYVVLIEGRTRAVDLEDVEGRLRVVVDGQERMVDARDLGGGAWSVLDGVTARLIQVDGSGPRLTIEVSHPDGEPRICTAEVSSGRPPPDQARAERAEAGPLTLTAPIPGRVVKVLVKVGETVKSGQTLLVLEAMKMENELRAPRAGVVSEVHAAEGSAVETGQKLVAIG